MTFEHESKRKKELLSVLGEVQSSASSLQGLTQRVLQDATETKELAGALFDVIGSAPNDQAMPQPVWDKLFASFSRQRDLMRSVTDSLTAQATLSATTQSIELTTTLSTQVFSAWISPPSALQRLDTVLHGPALFESTRESLRRFGLDSSHQTLRSPLTLLEAREALARPSGSAVAPAAVLIPAREAINAALAILLRLRPVQEPASKAHDKVISIGRQCGLPGLPAGHFEGLGANLEALMDELSDAKQRQIAGSAVARTLDNVMHFLRSFTQSLDPAKLRAS